MNLSTRPGFARLVLIGFVFLLAMASAGAAPVSPTWTQLIGNGAVGSPAPRFSHTAVYDKVGNNMIVFGGYGGSYLNDVWVLSHANGSGGAPTWTNITPGSGPAARDGHTAVYDATGNNMIVFGGFNVISYLNDVWVLSHANGSGATWTNITPGSGPAPAVREGHTAVYDATSNNMIVFGGYNGSYLNDVWVLSHANGSGGPATWTNITPGSGPAPSARLQHTAVYDATGKNMIVFGGYDNSDLNDVWVLSNANSTSGAHTWTNISPSSGSVPFKRDSHTAVYDPASNDMIVFGGCCSLNDVWMLSHANGSGGLSVWTNITPGSGPAPAARFAHTAVYDAAGNKMIVFGGVGSSDFNDVWVLADADPNQPPSSVAVNIDIRPNTSINTISRSTGTEVPVAILSSATFDAPSQVDRTSLTFGHAGTEASFKSCNLRAADVNADGYKDLVCHFNGTLGSFVLGDTKGYLQGKTTLGGTITGNDSVVIIK